MFEAFNCFGLYLQVTFASGRWAWLHHAGNVRFAGKGRVHVSTVPLNVIVMVLGQPVHRKVFHHVHSGAVTCKSAKFERACAGHGPLLLGVSP